MLEVFKLQMNHSRTIRTASRCIDDCCGKQTSEGKEKSHFYTITRISLSVGDVQRLMVWANSCKPNAACVRLRNTWTPEPWTSSVSPQKWQKWMQENGFSKFFYLPFQEKNDKLWGKFCLWLVLDTDFTVFQQTDESSGEMEYMNNILREVCHCSSTG